MTPQGPELRLQSLTAEIKNPDSVAYQPDDLPLSTHSSLSLARGLCGDDFPGSIPLTSMVAPATRVGSNLWGAHSAGIQAPS